MLTNTTCRINTRLSPNQLLTAVSILFGGPDKSTLHLPQPLWCETAIPSHVLGLFGIAKASGTARTDWVRRQYCHPVMSVPWNFTLSSDYASWTHKNSAEIQGVEGQCLQGIKATCKTNCCWEFLGTPGKCPPPSTITKKSQKKLHWHPTEEWC